MLIHVGGVSLQLGEARVAGPDQGADLGGGQGDRLAARPGMLAAMPRSALRIAGSRLSKVCRAFRCTRAGSALMT